MKRILLAAGLLVAAAAPGTALAGPYGEDLGRCAIGATTPADRSAMLRWSFLVAAANPSLADLITVTPEARTRSARAVADVFNRIVLRDCRAKALAALRHEGQSGFESGFEALGAMAAQEMMMTESGLAAIEEIVGLLDQAGLVALATEAAAQPPI
jgi:hypothetical protein